MESLDDLIRQAAKDGRLDGLTCWPCSQGYQSNFKTPSGGWRCEVDKDPVAAMKRALGAAPEVQGSIFD